MSMRKVLCFCTPFNNERIGGILRYAQKHKWHIVLSSADDHRFLGWNADGVLATLRNNSSGATIHHLFAERGTPIVDLTIERADLDLPRVICDHEAIGRMAGEHLYERGFRTFAWFSAGWSNVHALRYNGFAQIAKKEKLGRVKKWIASRADWTQFNTRITPLLLKAPKPLGILAYDEADAARLLSVCTELGFLVPEQVAVISCGNEPLHCDFQPITITGINTELDQQGYAAAQLLDKLMSGHAPINKTTLIPPKGVTLRQSTDAYTSSDPLVLLALRYISDNLTKDFTISQMARALDTTPYRLTKRFLIALNTNIGKEIIRQRLVRAHRLLLETDLSVNDISDRCGYCNPGYLVNTFRKAYGEPPAIYRRLHTA